MAHLQPQAEEGRKRRGQAQHQPQRNVGGIARDVGAQRLPPARRTRFAQPAGDARVVLDGRIQPVQHKPVFHPPGQNAGGKQQHPGESREKQRRPPQTERGQRAAGVGLVQHRVAHPARQQPRQQHGRRQHQQHIAQHRRHLRAHQVAHFIDKLLHRLVVGQVFQLGGHGRGGHGRLLGGHGEMQPLDQHKADGVVQTRRQPAPKRRQPQRIQAKLEQRGKGHDQAATGGHGQHVQVFTAGARDVVLARFGIALGHFGRQQRAVGGQQRAHAVALAPHAHQLRQQPQRVLRGRLRQQAVQQRAHTQDARTHLAQTKHQAHGDAVVLKVQVNGVDGAAAGVQALAQLVYGGVQPVAGAQRVQHLDTQGFNLAQQGVKRLGLALLGAHAHTQLGRKAGGQHLPGAVGHGVQQHLLPAHAGLFLVGPQQQRQQAPGGSQVERHQPLGIKVGGQRLREQLRGINRVGAARHHFEAQAFGKFAEKRRARGKAKVGQQGGDVQPIGHLAPPGLQALAQHGIGIHGIAKQAQARQAVVYRAGIATHPGAQVDEPQMALSAHGAGVQAGQQFGQVAISRFHGFPGNKAQTTRSEGLCPQCSTRGASGVCSSASPSVASSTNREMGQSKGWPSTLTHR